MCQPKENSNIKDICSKNLYIAFLAEFLGTMAIILFGNGATIKQEAVPDVTQISLAFGLTVASMVWAIGRVSGGHINPAVTLAFLLTRRCSLVRAVFYWVAQIGGGIVGAVVLQLISPEDSDLGMVALIPELNDVQGFFIELTMGAILSLVVFSSVDSQREDVSGSAPLSIGLAVTICHLWAVRLTGCGLNPARAFGPNLIKQFEWGSTDLDSFDSFALIYLVGPLIGSVVAAFFYEFLFAVNATPHKLKYFLTLSYDNDKFDSQGKKVEFEGEKVCGCC